MLRCKEERFCSGTAAGGRNLTTLIVLLVLGSALVGAVGVVVAFIAVRRVRKRRRDMKFTSAQEAGQMMLRPDDVIFHRDPITGAAQAYFTIDASRRLSNSVSNVLEYDNKGHPMVVALPNCGQIITDGFATVPNRPSYHQKTSKVSSFKPRMARVDEIDGKYPCSTLFNVIYPCFANIFWRQHGSKFRRQHGSKSLSSQKSSYFDAQFRRKSWISIHFFVESPAVVAVVDIKYPCYRRLRR